MNDATTWLESRGGYYALDEIARGAGITERLALDQLDAATRSGIVERREYRAARLVSGANGVHHRTAFQTFTQWRVREADAA